MADSGPFKIVGWMSDDFSSWLQADILGPTPESPLCPRKQTLEAECPVFSELRPLFPQQQTFPCLGWTSAYDP